MKYLYLLLCFSLTLSCLEHQKQYNTETPTISSIFLSQRDLEEAEREENQSEVEEVEEESEEKIPIALLLLGGGIFWWIGKYISWIKRATKI